MPQIHWPPFSSLNELRSGRLTLLFFLPEKLCLLILNIISFKKGSQDYSFASLASALFYSPIASVFFLRAWIIICVYIAAWSSHVHSASHTKFQKGKGLFLFDSTASPTMSPGPSRRLINICE